MYLLSMQGWRHVLSDSCADKLCPACSNQGKCSLDLMGTWPLWLVGLG